jgi:hypothetical protein
MSGRFLHAGVALICLLALLRTLSAQGAPSGPRFPGNTSRQFGTQSNTGQVVSAVVLASYVARIWGDDTRTLQMLVLWRGSPGWFARGSGGSSSSGGGDGRRYHSTIRRGDLQLQAEFDTETRLVTISQAPLVALSQSTTIQTATIKSTQINLGDRNVILVDEVDDPKGPQIVGTVRIDPALPPGRTPLPIDDILRRSPEIVSFLRCDTRMPDPLLQQMVEIVCARVLGQ